MWRSWGQTISTLSSASHQAPREPNPNSWKPWNGLRQQRRNITSPWASLAAVGGPRQSVWTQGSRRSAAPPVSAAIMPPENNIFVFPKGDGWENTRPEQESGQPPTPHPDL